MSRISELMDLHSEALERLTDREAAAFVKTYKSASRELVSRVALARSDDARQRLRIQLAQVDQGILELTDRLNIQLGTGVRKAQAKGLRDLVRMIRVAEPRLGETAGGVEVQALSRLQRGLALHQYSVRSYTATIANALQRDLVQSTAQGEGVDAMEKRLRATLAGSKLESRAWLIARMELSRSYNDAELIGIEEADREIPGGMMKRIHETTDRRNHPFSRAAHGVVAKAGEPFRVSVAAVAAAGAAMGKGTGGILWERKGEDFVGMNLPAHFGERGRVVPWRKEWAG